MSYGLGVDLGTTFTAAAVARDGRVEMATLGDHTDAVPSVVLIRDDGTVLTGWAAERRATVEPDRVARSVKRRFGDPMPVILGGAPHPATGLIAHQLRDVVDFVSDREGCRPGMVTLTHPANWGPYKRELFAQVPRLAGLGEVHMLTEPEAAAAHYARNDRLDPGALVAVYDLGGGTFDATVLRTTERGFDILGRPEGIEGLGGLDFDEAVFAHVDRTLDGAVSRLDPADPRATSAAIRLRHECVTAKETLSADTETTIPVLLPELQTEVRLTRGEFEKMIRPAINATIASLRRALQSARIDPPQLHTVLLVGGSSRIPMVAHLVSAELGRPTSVDTHPKHAIALGAAAESADTAVGGAAATAEAVPVRLTPPPAAKAGPAEASAPVPPMTAASAPALAAPPRRRLPLVIGALVLVAALAGGGIAANRALSNPTPTTIHQPHPPASHGSGGGSGTTTGSGSGAVIGGGSGTTTGGGSGTTTGGGSGTTTGDGSGDTGNTAPSSSASPSTSPSTSPSSASPSTSPSSTSPTTAPPSSAPASPATPAAGPATPGG
jgi:molecular chaperone DnaK